MTYRPKPKHRKNITRVIFPLTEAIQRLYGVRDDGAYPIGAFYTVNIDKKVWEPAGGIWYRPLDLEKIENRKFNREDAELFAIGIKNGVDTLLSSGKIITWEPIPDPEIQELPLLP